MKKMFSFIAAVLFCGSLSSQDITVFPLEKTGAIKLMNGVNNGPKRESYTQVIGNFEYFRDARFSFTRTHDSSASETYGGVHAVDITAIFPDFDAKVNDPSSYDFTFTDVYLKNIIDAGSQVFFRLGQKIENRKEKKYNIFPPKDYKKWALICEHIIRHYNEGWADGYNWNIRYWEIWNEADLGWSDDKPDSNPRTWGGTREEFFKFYEVAAKHLKKCFPELEIGGPALAGNEKWCDLFLEYCQSHQVPMDFFSWHRYTTKPADAAAKAGRMRVALDKYGYTSTVSVLNEWNYVRDWKANFRYSLEVMASMKGAAFNAAFMSALQDSPTDIMMYYDARIETRFNGLFDLRTLAPLKPYYPFYAWAKLLDCGNAVKTSFGENVGKDLYVTAAVTDDGSEAGILVTRYNEDDNVSAPKGYSLKTDGYQYKKAVGHITDSARTYTEIPLYLTDGTVSFTLEPNSVLYIELR